MVYAFISIKFLYEIIGHVRNNENILSARVSLFIRYFDRSNADFARILRPNSFVQELTLMDLKLIHDCQHDVSVNQQRSAIQFPLMFELSDIADPRQFQSLIKG